MSRKEDRINAAIERLTRLFEALAEAAREATRAIETAQGVRGKHTP